MATRLYCPSRTVSLSSSLPVFICTFPVCWVCHSCLDEDCCQAKDILSVCCVYHLVCLLYILMKSSRSEQGAHVFTCCGWCNVLVAVHPCSEPCFCSNSMLYASILIILKLTFRSLVRLLQQGCRPLTLESR